MKQILLTLILAAGLAPDAGATIVYHVSLNTTPLIGNVAGPFSIDLQLVGNQGTAVTVSLITFGGGSQTGVGNCFFNCTGDLSTVVSMNAASGFFNEFYQTFAPGASLLFDVAFANVIPPPGGGPNGPDAFSFAILDSSLNEIPMQAGNGSFLTISLDSATSPTVMLNSNDPSGSPVIGVINAPSVTSVSGIPEPGSIWLAGAALVLLAALYQGRQLQSLNAERNMER